MKTTVMPQAQRPASRQNFQPAAGRQSAPPAARPAQETPDAKPRSSGPSVNKVVLIGTLTRDPEVKMTPKGTPFTGLSLALNRSYQTEQGERREETAFVDVELWGRQAEIAGEFLRKGRPVFIEGRLKLDTWEDKETGQKRSKLKVVGETMQLLGGREEGNSGNSKPLPPPPRNGAHQGRDAYAEQDEFLA